MEEERQRRILEDLLDERLHAERKVILEVLAGVLVNERQSVGGDEVEEMRQLRLEVEQFERDDRRPLDAICGRRGRLAACQRCCRQRSTS
jgi:hypothetical protein